MMERNDGRLPDELRKIKVTKDYTKHAEGACLIEFGETRIVCTATVEDSVPAFLRNSGKGWVTAEYGMLPRSTTTRIQRDKAARSGRTLEIQRLIGRSLRGVVDMGQLGERTVKVDCDVIQADGGTRTAAISGGFIALALALKKIKGQGMLDGIPLTDFVAAVSVGIHDGNILLDLNYLEDVNAQMDMNVVMVGKGKFIEVQGTAEHKAFSKNDMDKLLDLAKKGIDEIITVQKKNIGKLE